jgi:2-dehydro-3-deoxyphosphogluconate aldolase/(4S)-4-hydroxy-2-oxoglutarate aldolase
VIPNFKSHVVPVVEIDDASHAVSLARALLAAGIDVIEVTLRTSHALQAIAAIANAQTEIVLAAGTVLNAQQLRAARDAGASLAISPGVTAALLSAARQTGLPFVPGVASASEAMQALEYGFTFLKLFPAQAAGGVPLLKALSQPLPQLSFMPTGGIDAGNYRDYLTLPNVRCVGGSWLAPRKLIAQQDWAGITAIAKAAGAHQNGAF